MRRFCPVILRRVAFPLARIAVAVLIGFFVLSHFSRRIAFLGEVFWSLAAHRHVWDRADVLPLADYLGFNNELVLVENESGIAVEVMTVRLARGASLERLAAEEATRRHLGSRHGDRGVLLIYDATSRRLRAELGYGLEGYFSDAFIGRLVADHAALFFQSGQPALGLKLLVDILKFRIHDQMLGGRFDPAPFAPSGVSPYVSGGAGASASAPLRDDGTRAFRTAGVMTRLSAPERRRFTAQAAVEDAHARYMEWLRAGSFDLDIDLFTPASKYLLAARPGMSRPYMDFLLATVWGRPHAVVQRGNLAILYYTDTPLVPPEFFQRDSAGWRIDIDAAAFSTREHIGGLYTWCLTQDGYPPRVFGDLFAIYLGVCERVRAGDNRVLPVPAHR